MRSPVFVKKSRVAELEILNALLIDARERCQVLGLEEAFRYLVCAEAVVVENLIESETLPAQ